MDPKLNGEWSASEIRMVKSLIASLNANKNYANDTNSKHNYIVSEIQSRFPLKERRQVITLYVELVVQMTQAAQSSSQYIVTTNDLVHDNFGFPVEDPAMESMDMLLANLTDETPNAMMMVEEAPQMQVVIPQQEKPNKGKFWTKEEHRQFLRGLYAYGRGKWKNISRDFVTNKTPVQVSSHAQKYFRRQERTSGKQRYSINDVSLYDAEPWMQNNSSSLEPLAFAGDSYYNPNCNGSGGQPATMNNLAQVWPPFLYSASQVNNSQATTWTGQQIGASSSAAQAMGGSGSQMAWTGDQHQYFLPGQWMGKDNMY